MRPEPRRMDDTGLDLLADNHADAGGHCRLCSHGRYLIGWPCAVWRLLEHVAYLQDAMARSR